MTGGPLRLVRGSKSRVESEVIDGMEMRGKHAVPVYSSMILVCNEGEYLGFRDFDGVCYACHRRIGSGCVFRRPDGTTVAFGRHCLRKHARVQPSESGVDAHE